MRTYNLRWVTLGDAEETKSALAQIGADPAGIAHMAGKAVSRGIKLEKVPLPAALILKQEMLAVGGDAAVHRDVIVNKTDATDVMLLGTIKQLELLSKKLAAQPFGLKNAGREIKRLLEILAPAPPRVLSCRGRELTLGARTLVMGILNVTPDSFYDGGRYDTPEKIITQAKKLVEEGADILDVGAESSKPGHEAVSAEEEWRRLEHILPELLAQIKIPVSIDTSKAGVAAKALQAGVHLVNDVWGLQKDPEMAAVAGEYQAPVIVMHNQENTVYRCLMGDILAYLEKSAALAEDHGLKGEQIIVDPGLGFGKTAEQNLEILSRLAELRTLGHPILLGASRKATIGKVLKQAAEDRLAGTLALNVLGVAAGVDIIRVHDVLANRSAVQMADSVVRGKRGFNYAGA